MAVWEIVRDAFAGAAAEGERWLTGGEAVRRVTAEYPDTKHDTIRHLIAFYCINDRLREHSGGQIWRRNPLYVTDSPSIRGKRYRLLTGGEREAFLADPRAALEFASYAQVAEWVAGGEPPAAGGAEDARGGEDEDDAEEAGFGGLALFELHLQDYLHRHWAEAFPGLALHRGDEGREFVTRDPPVGVLDFLARDGNGDWVVIETRRDRPDRQAVGQVLSYMGWVRERLCAEGESVRGILIAGDVSDRLRMAVAAVPGLDVRRYEVSFRLHDGGDPS